MFGRGKYREKGQYEKRVVRDRRENRNDYRDNRDKRNYRDSRDSRDSRDRCSRDYRDTRNYRGNSEDRDNKVNQKKVIKYKLKQNIVQRKQSEINSNIIEINENKYFFTSQSQIQKIFIQKIKNISCHKLRRKFQPFDQDKNKRSLKKNIVKIPIQINCQTKYCNTLKDYKQLSYGIIQLKYMMKNLQQFSAQFPNQSTDFKQKQIYNHFMLWELNFYDLECKICSKKSDVKIFKHQILLVIQAFQYQLNQSLIFIQNYIKRDKINKQQQNQKQQQSLNKDQNQDQQKDKQKDNQKDEQLPTFYPFSKWHTYTLFRKKNVFDKPTYNRNQCSDYILQELKKMSVYGYDFRIQPQWKFQKKRYPIRNIGQQDQMKKMKRKIYLRMKCKKCKDRNGQYRTWTSILGLGQIIFRVDDIKDFLQENPNLQQNMNTSLGQALCKKYPKCVCWSLKIYSMKCKTCNNFGQPFIYQTQLQAFAKSFCLIISHVIEGNKRSGHRDNRYKNNKDMHKHQQSLCQACQRGKCYNINIGAKGKTSRY